MSLLTRHPGLRWAVPAGVAGVIVAGTLVAPRVALADPQLPARTAQELLVDLQERPRVPLSGTVAVAADLGLPELPDELASESATGLLSGESTLRVWLDGPQRQRLALLGPASEKVLVHNRTDVWSWSSQEATADHLVLPESEADVTHAPDGVAGRSGMAPTPEEAAELALSALDPTTAVTAEGAGRVAGREAYQLVLSPKDDITLVDRMVLSLDAENSTPLRFAVYSTKQADPAFEVGFTSVDFSTPDPSVFTFSPPPGAKVTEHSSEDLAAAAGTDSPGVTVLGHRSLLASLPEPEVVGKGWSSVLVATLPVDALANLAERASGEGTRGEGAGDGPAGGPADDAASALAVLQLLPVTSGPWGSGRVLAGTLFTVIITEDGRVAVGAVPPDVVGDALARTSS